MKRLTATTALCVLFCTAFAAGKGPAATVPGGYPDSLRSVWLYTEGIKQNTIFHDTVRAREYLTEAIRADSTYAPAYYEMATNGMYSTPDEAVELARRFPHVYAAVGIHPENCGDFRPEDLDAIRALAREDKVVAIGEIGLDYYWPENPPRPLQQQVLRSQLALARELSLPVIIHDRDAHADTMAIVREFPRVRGVFHCFAGSVEMARELVDMGWYLSFNGAATFKNARKAPEVIRAVPMDRLMIETDAPYLTPVPYRGRRNDSTYVRLVAEKIAQLRDMTPQEVEQATWENGKRFFGI